MMNYEIFKEVVKEKFMDYMPEKFKGMELVAEPVEKVNVTLDGIILREEGRNISPTIYINDMYKKYQDCGDLEETLMAACDFMERAYEQAPVVDVDSIMKDANEKIVFQLINTEQNKTFLEQVPHREFQDLSIVYKVIISADKDAVQSSKITNEFAKRLGMSEEQLFKCAAENTRRLFPPVVRSMNDIMKEMFARDIAMKYDGYQVGIVIKSLRIQRNLTKEALATELGISESTIKKYENGERALSITNLFKIIDYFKVDANTILNVAESKKESSIDSRLELMDCSKRAYFQKIFNEMLDNAEMLVS